MPADRVEVEPDQAESRGADQDEDDGQQKGEPGVGRAMKCGEHGTLGCLARFVQGRVSL